MRLNADLESGRSLVSHPRRKAGKGAVKLVHNEKRGAASLKPPPNVHDLAEAGVKSVSDACFSLLFVGSMSPFRASTAQLPMSLAIFSAVIFVIYLIGALSIPETRGNFH